MELLEYVSRRNKLIKLMGKRRFYVSIALPSGTPYNALVDAENVKNWVAEASPATMAVLNEIYRQIKNESQPN